jgi:GNAT superfamily N-acetyltransferase
MIRPGRASDMADITHVRTSVAENHLSVAQMAELGITPESIIAEMESGDLGCWVAEDVGRVIAFSMADRRDASIFALFVLPDHEGRGHGTRLLDACERWLRAQGHRSASLTTGRGTKAHDFYLRRGWQVTGEIAGHFAEDDVFRKDL